MLRHVCCTAGCTCPARTATCFCAPPIMCPEQLVGLSRLCPASTLSMLTCTYLQACSLAWRSWRRPCSCLRSSSATAPKSERREPGIGRASSPSNAAATCLPVAAFPPLPLLRLQLGESVCFCSRQAFGPLLPPSVHIPPFALPRHPLFVQHCHSRHAPPRSTAIERHSPLNITPCNCKVSPIHSTSQLNVPSSLLK